MIQEGMEQLREICQAYFFDFRYVGLLAAAVLLLLIWERKKESMGLFGVCGILLLLLVNPIMVSLISGLTPTQRYIRIFWVFPFIPVIACCGRRLTEQAAGIKRAVLFLLAAAVIVGAGEPVLGNGNFGQAENLYKLPQEVIEVADAIEEYKGEDVDSPYVIATVYLSTYLRQYDGNIRLLFGRNYVTKAEKKLYRMLYKNADQDFSYEDIYDLGLRAIACGADMIVLNKYQVMNEALDSLGFERIDATENYYIFRYTK